MRLNVSLIGQTSKQKLNHDVSSNVSRVVNGVTVITIGGVAHVVQSQSLGFCGSYRVHVLSMTQTSDTNHPFAHSSHYMDKILSVVT